MIAEYERLLKSVEEADNKLFIRPSASDPNAQPYVDLSNEGIQVPADPTKPLPIQAQITNLAAKLNNLDLQHQALVARIVQLNENLANIAVMQSSSRSGGF
jgi:hypothetical protein